MFYYCRAVEELSHSCHQFNLSSRQVAWPLAMQNQSTTRYFNVTTEQNAIFACECHVRKETNGGVKHLYDRLLFFVLIQQCVVFQSWISVSAEDLISVMNFESHILYAFNYTEASHRICSSVLACQVYCQLRLCLSFMY